MLSGLYNTPSAKPVKPTRLYATSWNARPGDSNTSFTDVLQSTVDNIKQVSLVQCTIPHLFPTVGVSESLVYFSYKGSDRVLTLDTTRRFATTQELAVHIQALCAAVGALSDITVSIVSTDGYDRIQFSHPSQAPASNDVRFQNESQRPLQNASWKLGVAAPVYAAAAGTSSARGDGIVRLARTTCVYVLSNLSNDSADSYGTQTVLAVIPVDVPWGQVVQFRAFTESWLDCATSAARDLFFQLLDDQRDVLSLPSNAYVSIGLDTRPYYG